MRHNNDQEITNINDNEPLDIVHQQQRTFSFSKLKIVHRIYAGFAVVLALLAGIAAFSAYEFDQLEAKFEYYDDMSDDSALVNELQELIIAAQMASREYLDDSNDEKQQAYMTKFRQTSDLMVKIESEFQDPRKVELIGQISAELTDYATGFDAIVSLTRRRDELVYEVIRGLSEKMDVKLTKIRQQALLDDDDTVASSASEMQEKLLKAQLHTVTFLDDSTQQNADLIGSEMTEARAHYKKIVEKTTVNGLIEVLEALKSDAVAYFEATNELIENIFSTEDIRARILDQGAKDILARSEEIVRMSEIEEARLLDGVFSLLNKSINALIVVCVIALAFGLFFATVIGQGITKPIARLTDVMGKLAHKDFAAEVPGRERHDELGQMAKAVEIFKQGGLHTMELEAQQAEQKRLAEQEKKQLLMKMADEFDQHVGGIVTAVTSSAEQLNTTAISMASVSDQTSTQAAQASAASEQTSGNVQSVACATEEMNQTISEVSKQVNKASIATQEAVEKVKSTNGQMETLALTSNTIGEVIEMISTIAEQTNLLALNATIESARAGAAGKGFAVVAAEVKELANQTSRATSEIGDKITEIQDAAKQASNSMEDVGEVIENVDRISRSIVEVMEEQNASTREIADNINQVARGADAVNSNIQSVTEASKIAGDASGEVRLAASELSQQSGVLKEEVDRFIAQIRVG